jgi:OOP family OmpA-OmpF porin
MAPLKNILFGSGLLLCMTGLVHAASPAQQVTAAASADSQATGNPQDTGAQQPSPATGATNTPPPATPGSPPGATAPGASAGKVLVVPATATSPEMIVPLSPAAPATGAYVPKTPFDNTPHRFNMTQGGKKMSANDFDAWMRAKGYRVAKGRPPADCPNAPPAGVETIVGPDGCPVEISIELDGVTFEFAKATLRPEARKTLDQAVEILKRHPELTVEVAGHTDSRGAADFNQKLSESRAKAVYDYLVEKGIEKKQLEGPIGYGESKPIASNDTDAGRNENRRTELNIKAVAALPATATGAPAPGAGPVVLPAAPGNAASQGAPAPAPVPATNTGTEPAPTTQPTTVPPNSPPGTLPTQQPAATPPDNP